MMGSRPSRLRSELAAKASVSHAAAIVAERYLRILQLSRKTFYAPACYGPSPVATVSHSRHKGKSAPARRDGCFTQHKFYAWNRGLPHSRAASSSQVSLARVSHNLRGACTYIHIYRPPLLVFLIRGGQERGKGGEIDLTLFRTNENWPLGDA